MVRIVVIAGEASGDRLGASFIRSARRLNPDVRIEGIAGPAMRAAGCEPWFDSQELAVMGLFEVMRHLPRLLRIRRAVVRRLLADPPDVLLGIDAPDFNLRVEKIARRAGIPTVHYVCPSVWAWRESRVRVLRAACDHILCLLPFEPAFLARHGIDAEFVGHPLADEIPGAPDRDAARRALKIDTGRVVAIMPGSRAAEVTRIGPVLAQTAAWLDRRADGLRFVVPAASPQLRSKIQAQFAARAPRAVVTVLDGQAHAAIAASDAVLLVSGTAALEVMLSGRPMVVAYKMAPLTYLVARALHAIGLMKIEYISLPNLLAGRALVPELIQRQATADSLGRAMLDALAATPRREELIATFGALGEGLRRSAADRAANAVLRLAGAVES